jgi:hypothetical protein
VSMISAAAKRLRDAMALVTGAGLMGYSDATNYAAGTIGARLRALIAGPTFTGPVVLPGDATQAMQAATKQQMDAGDSRALMLRLNSTRGVNSAAYARIDETGTVAITRGAVNSGGWFAAPQAGLVRVAMADMRIVEKSARILIDIFINEVRQGLSSMLIEGADITSLDVVLLVAAGDVLSVRAINLVGLPVTARVGSIAFEYLGPAA